jgi:DNA polymerase-4
MFSIGTEQMDNHMLRGKPIVVGGSENRGVVAAALENEVRSAISGVLLRKLSELIFVKPSF